MRGTQGKDRKATGNFSLVSWRPGTAAVRVQISQSPWAGEGALASGKPRWFFYALDISSRNRNKEALTVIVLASSSVK